MSAPQPQRPFLGIHLKCCHLYVRLYLATDRSAYAGWCPRCATPVRIPVVETGGSSARFFEAS